MHYVIRKFFLAFGLHNLEVFLKKCVFGLHNSKATLWRWHKKIKKIFFTLCMRVAEEPMEEETVFTQFGSVWQSFVLL